MKTITIESNTEYFAKKRVIQEGLKFFKAKKKESSVKIISKAKESDANWDKPITFTKTIHRDKLAQALGYQSITKDYDKIVIDPELGKKPVVLSVFDRL